MNTFKRLIRPEQLRELSLVVLILAGLLFFNTQINNYLTPRLFNRISMSVAVIAVVAVGQTLVMLTRNIDLSVGSIVGFTAYFLGTQLTKTPELHPALAVLLALGAGAVLGAINGGLVAYGKVPAIIVTLGTLALFRAALVEYGNAKTVTADGLPQWLVDLPGVSAFTWFGLDFRLLVVMALVVVIIFQLVITYMRFGRQLYAIGSNPEAAKTAGLPAARLVFMAYVLCGALAGLGGFIFLAQYGTITVQAASGTELQVVAAAVVGGVNTFGGSGTMFGALLGAVLIDLLHQSLIRWLSISEFWQDALLGLLILLAVASDAIIINRLRQLWAPNTIRALPAGETPEAGHAK